MKKKNDWKGSLCDLILYDEFKIIELFKIIRIKSERSYSAPRVYIHILHLALNVRCEYRFF